MPRLVFQVRDAEGAPQGGHVYEAPTGEALAASVASSPLPEGWTREEVADEAEIIAPPPVPVEVPNA
ncbi:MAG TPA: hypothetical protein VK150_05780 [Geothrix sp.]|nr:hypothetical protein [Geothrix sp.]